MVYIGILLFIHVSYYVKKIIGGQMQIKRRSPL